MRTSAMLSLIVLLATLSSCVPWQSSFVPTNAAPRALTSRSPADVPVLTSGAPAADHVDVGLIDFAGADAARPDEAVELKMLQDRGAKEGCDAVVAAYRGHGAHLYGTCIVYTRRTRG